MGIERERKRPFPLFERIMGGLNSGADLENYIGREERGKKGSTGLKKTVLILLLPTFNCVPALP